MPALPIVESRNVIEDISIPVLTGCVVPMVDEFMLECSKETLNTGVVTAAPSLRHVGDNDVSGEQQLVPRGGILATETRVAQELCQWVLICQRHGEGLLGQPYGLPVSDRPADH